jgi:hypothetical protein
MRAPPANTSTSPLRRIRPAGVPVVGRPGVGLTEAVGRRDPDGVVDADAETPGDGEPPRVRGEGGGLPSPDGLGDVGTDGEPEGEADGDGETGSEADGDGLADGRGKWERDVDGVHVGDGAGEWP